MQLVDVSVDGSGATRYYYQCDQAYGSACPTALHSSWAFNWNDIPSDGLPLWTKYQELATRFGILLAQSPPTSEDLGIYSLYASEVTGGIAVDVGLRGSGTLRIYVNDVLKDTHVTQPGDLSYNIIIPLSAGTYSVKAVGTGNSQTTSVTVAGTSGTPQLKTYELRIHYYNLGWGTPSMLEAEVRHILTMIDPILKAMGYYTKNQYRHDTQNKILSLYFEGYSEPVTAATILTLIATVAAVFLALGFVITSMSWYQEAKAVAVLAQTKADILKQAAEDYSSGKITKEQYDNIVGTLEKLDTLPEEKDKGTNWGTIVLTLSGLAIGVFLLKDVIGGKR